MFYRNITTADGDRQEENLTTNGFFGKLLSTREAADFLGDTTPAKGDTTPAKGDTSLAKGDTPPDFPNSDSEKTVCKEAKL